MEKKKIAKAELVFEVSWEVCNKVGGIYTVVSSKAARMIEIYGDNYYAVGPYFMNKARGDFKEEILPPLLKEVSDVLRREGIIIRYGRWLIDGSPQTILIDFSAFAQSKNEIKKELWEKFKIDTLNSDYFDLDQPVIWAYSAGKLIEEFSQRLNSKSVCVQAHEWLSGSTILYLKRCESIATVFTTHATVLGRSISSSNLKLYSMLKTINADEECYKFGVHSKHQIEKACAQNADVFTTVSEITGLEATYLLGKKPDVLLPNGLDLNKFPTFEQASINHDHLKRKIREFIAWYFFPYYAFSLEDTLIYFISGRYEFHNKGIDSTIIALGRVNELMKKEKIQKNVVVFFYIPGNVRGVKPELLENKTLYEDIKEKIDLSINDVKTRLIFSLVNETIASCGDLFGLENLKEIQRRVNKFRKGGLPSLSTHDLYNEDSDDILKGFRINGLLNREEDKVKVIFYPTYMSGSDGLLDIDYYESIQGSHLGIFPSYYEPWGYTPLECGALGVASITTDLAGFGRFLLKKEPEKGGIFIIRRDNKADDEVVLDLTKTIFNFTKLPKDERVKNKLRAAHLAASADWKVMIFNYIEAHNLALSKK